MNVFTRNIKAKLIAFAVGLVVFVGLQVFSMTVMKDDYVFSWLGENKYSYVWVLAAVMIIFDQTLISYILMFGTILGACIGKFLGDFLEERTLAKITPDMDSGQVSMIIDHAHKGIFMYWYTVFGCLVIGIVLSIILRKRRDRRQENA